MRAYVTHALLIVYAASTYDCKVRIFLDDMNFMVFFSAGLGSRMWKMLSTMVISRK